MVTLKIIVLIVLFILYPHRVECEGVKKTIVGVDKTKIITENDFICEYLIPTVKAKRKRREKQLQSFIAEERRASYIICARFSSIIVCARLIRADIQNIYLTFL